jgi:hypothetical protein
LSTLPVDGDLVSGVGGGNLGSFDSALAAVHVRVRCTRDGEGGGDLANRTRRVLVGKGERTGKGLAIDSDAWEKLLVSEERCLDADQRTAHIAVGGHAGDDGEGKDSVEQHGK